MFIKFHSILLQNVVDLLRDTLAKYKDISFTEVKKNVITERKRIELIYTTADAFQTFALKYGWYHLNESRPVLREKYDRIRGRLKVVCLFFLMLLCFVMEKKLNILNDIRKWSHSGTHNYDPITALDSVWWKPYMIYKNEVIPRWRLSFFFVFFQLLKPLLSFW